MTLVAALQPIVEAFERLGVSYHIGGSVASSMHGSPRSTNDIDLLVGLRHEHVLPLCTALGDAFYADDAMLHDAITHGSSANLVHLATGWKVDLFVCGESPSIARRSTARSLAASLRARVLSAWQPPKTSCFASSHGIGPAARFRSGSGATFSASCACPDHDWIARGYDAGRPCSA